MALEGRGVTAGSPRLATTATTGQGKDLAGLVLTHWTLTYQAERMASMTKDRFLTVRWNNILTLGLGVPALVYVVVAFSNSLWTRRGGLIGLAVIGALY